jgi:hypothetical protein
MRYDADISEHVPGYFSCYSTRLYVRSTERNCLGVIGALITSAACGFALREAHHRQQRDGQSRQHPTTHRSLHRAEYGTELIRIDWKA